MTHKLFDPVNTHLCSHIKNRNVLVLKLIPVTRDVSPNFLPRVGNVVLEVSVMHKSFTLFEVRDDISEISSICLKRQIKDVSLPCLFLLIDTLTP